MMDNIAANQEKTKKKPLRQLAWLPIPFFLVLMIILWVLHLKGEYELPALMIIVNFLVRTLACLLIMYLVGRSFLVNGAPYLLMIGCGMAIWMASGFVSTASLSREANFGVTISNVGIWMAALCHLSGVILSIRSKRTIRPARLWLGVAYTLALGAAGLVVLATLAGWLPVFFIDGQGGTPVRYIILASAFTMFTLATILLWKANRPSLSSFVYWYMLALLLIAIGLLGMMVQSYRASLLDWVCRTSQYLSGIYMFIAAIASRRELKVHGITLTQAINEPIYRFGLTITVIAAATAVRLAFTPILRMHVPFLTFYPAVMVAALYGGLWTGLLATVLSTLTVNCFFIEPIGSSVINQPAVWLEIVAFCVSCMMLSFVTEAMHRAQAKLLSHQEYLEELVKARTLELEREIIERKRVEKDLQAKQQEITVANEELQAQWEKLIAANEELHAQTEELNFTYQELQCQTEEIRKHEKVTARARDEAEQRAAELDATISSIAAGVIIYDNMGNVIRVNDYAHVLYKLTSEDYQLSYQECLTGLQMHKSDGIAYATEEAPLKRALRGEVIRDEEMMMVTISEKPLWLSSTWAPIYSNSGNLMGVIFIFTDITESKRKAEDRLASERELLKVTLNSLGEGVVAIDQKKQIIFLNEAAAKLSGYSQDEAIGKPVSKILYILDDKTSEPLDNISSQAAPGNPILVTHDLKEVVVAMNSTPIKDNDGQVIGTVIVLQDITEKQKIEQELLKAAKLDSLGILAGGVAHDFNNILAGILANLQLAAVKLKKHQDISKYMESSIAITRKASNLTKQLLTFAKGGDPVKKSADIAKLIRETVQFALSGSNVKAEFHLPEDLWVVDIDEGQIAQVINNLTINAEQAMLTGGILEFYGENIIFETADQYTPNHYVKITIKDHGIGIPAEIIHKIFDPFFTTKKTGNGLGLSTSHSIIKKHNGYFEVESAPGIGTTFYIILPASMNEVTLIESQKEIAASGEAKILLMDDEDSIRNVGGEMLSYFGYQVTLARGGQEAIDLYKRAKEIGEPFDMVIMDLTVPGGLGGIETMAVLRQIDPDIKAIISSGYASDPVMSDYERYGFSGVVIKPYKYEELIEVLNKVIDKKQLPLDFIY